jgi:hypothetical protein
MSCRPPYAGGPTAAYPFLLPQWFQASTNFKRVAAHDYPPLPVIPDGLPFTTLQGSLHATARSFASHPGLATTRFPGPSGYIVTLAFSVLRHRRTVRIRLDGRTGNLPSCCLSQHRQRQRLVRLH